MEMDYMLHSDGWEIPCRLVQPDMGNVRRVVLGVHGFGGCMEDEIQAGIAEEMTLFGAASVRLTFPAMGAAPMTECPCPCSPAWMRC